MIESYEILIIDDHPLIVDGYKSALEFGFGDETINIDTANNCDEAAEKIQSNNGNYNLVILDINIPNSIKLNLNSGEDLGLWLRKNFKGIKIVVITFHSDPIRLNNIAKNLNPEGFLIKSEVDSKEIIETCKNVLSGKIVYGKTVSQLLLNKSRNNFKLDSISLRILTEISNGTRTIDLPKYVPLSKSGIEKRKRLLKNHFNTKTDSDRELILSAKKNGYI